jgi:hypothetical protein
MIKLLGFALVKANRHPGFGPGSTDRMWILKQVQDN